jgi:hypothetical protein
MNWIHISDHDLERYYLGMVAAEKELDPLEAHILVCRSCAARADATQDYVDTMRVTLLKSSDQSIYGGIGGTIPHATAVPFVDDLMTQDVELRVPPRGDRYHNGKRNVSDPLWSLPCGMQKYPMLLSCFWRCGQARAAYS